MRPPIFLIGSERSGTNLLRVILDRHSNISGPVPPHLIKHVFENEPYYGNLNQDQNFRTLVEDVLELIYSHIKAWDIDFKVEGIIQQIDLNERSFLAVFDYLYSKRAKKKGKRRWFCKGNHLYKYPYQLNNYWPDARFIYLVRDPRDYCLSFLNVPGGPATIYTASKLWAHEQKICIRLSEDTGLKDSVLLIKYEDILRDASDTIETVCDFIGEEFESTMLEPDKRRESDKTEYWKNLSKGIMKNNMKKYSQLDDDKIKIIESIARKQMSYLNYKREFKNSQLINIPTRKKIWYKVLDKAKRKLNKVLKMDAEERSSRKEKSRASKQVSNRCLLD